MNPDPDPGGPKTRGSGGSGSGSATLAVAEWKDLVRRRRCSSQFKRKQNKVLTKSKRCISVYHNCSVQLSPF